MTFLPFPPSFPSKRRRIQTWIDRINRILGCLYRTVMAVNHLSIPTPNPVYPVYPCQLKLPRKPVDIPRNRVYTGQQSKPPNFSREEIAMSLRKIVAVLGLFVLINAIGGGGNRFPGSVDPLGLRRLASLCPRRPHDRHPRVPGRKPGQDPLLRHRPVRYFQQSRNLGRRQRPQRAGRYHLFGRARHFPRLYRRARGLADRRGIGHHRRQHRPHF